MAVPDPDWVLDSPHVRHLHGFVFPGEPDSAH
jgi:hypothetical protein